MFGLSTSRPSQLDLLSLSGHTCSRCRGAVLLVQPAGLSDSRFVRKFCEKVDCEKVGYASNKPLALANQPDLSFYPQGSQHRPLFLHYRTFPTLPAVFQGSTLSSLRIYHHHDHHSPQGPPFIIRTPNNNLIGSGCQLTVHNTSGGKSLPTRAPPAWLRS